MAKSEKVILGLNLSEKVPYCLTLTHGRRQHAPPRRRLLSRSVIRTHGAEPGRGVAARADLVRVASVTTAVEGGVLPALAEAFHAETGQRAVIAPMDDPYHEAEAGKADLVISHLGHRNTESFVLRGLGHWPRTVFSL
jgi:hypothetical protein